MGGFKEILGASWAAQRTSEHCSSCCEIWGVVAGIGVDDPHGFINTRFCRTHGYSVGRENQILFVMPTSSLSEPSLLPSSPALSESVSKTKRRVPLTLKVLYTTFAAICCRRPRGISR